MDKDFSQHFVNRYRLQTAVVITRGFLSVVDGHTRAARKIGVKDLVFVPYRAVQVRCLGTKENDCSQLQQRGKMSRATVVGDHEGGD